jgi:hypothetical protein
MQTNADVVELYRKHAARQLATDPQWLDPLIGYTHLACWCSPDLPCHADVLIELIGQNGQIVGLNARAADRAR